MAVRTSETEVQARSVHVALCILLLAMLPAALDQTVLSPALLAIGGELGGMGWESWVTCAYMLSMITSVLVWGRLGDLAGRKSLFIVSLVIFLIGSALSGLAWDMGSLYVFRAVQGFGGGGVVVLTQAIVGDLVPPRRRGRYQGLFGALFGVASIVGPLFGGFFVDQLSWRWTMLVNLPIIVTLIALAAIVLPATAELERRRVDYLGALLLMGSLALAMVAVLGLVHRSWGLRQSIAIAVVAGVLSVGWWLAQHRAAEPTLPLRLLRNKVFIVGSAIDYIVGFLMFGSLIYVPLYLQVVAGDSPTVSGVRLLPMILGVLIMAVVSGQVISRTGKYKLVLLTGMALITLGLLLCSRLDGSTGELPVGVALGVLGCGLGLVVQVPIIAVQNAVDYRDLGVATSGVTLSRAVGGLTGITVFSAILGHQLTGRIAQAAQSIERARGLDIVADTRVPYLFAELPPAVRVLFAEAFERSFQAMFLWSVPVALVGVGLALSIRGAAVRATANVLDFGESFGGAPTVRSSRREIERQFCELLRSDASTTEKVAQTYTELGAEVGSDCPPGALWALCRVARSRSGSIPVSTLSGRAGVTPEDGRPFVNRLVADGLVIRENGNIAITEAGKELAERLHEARRHKLHEFLDGWSDEDFPHLHDQFDQLSWHFLGDDTDQPLLKRTPVRYTSGRPS